MTGGFRGGDRSRDGPSGGAASRRLVGLGESRIVRIAGRHDRGRELGYTTSHHARAALQ